ncbi:MAG: TlpA disulfide reductase family protein, partial [Bacteroidota bacterium]
LLVTSCIVIPDTYSGLPPGPWRAVLKLDTNPVTPNPKGEPLPDKVDLTFDEVTEGELPFTFEVVYDTEDKFHIEVFNGDERIVVDDIEMGRSKSRARDTIRINFTEFDTYITGFFEENVIEGFWVVPYRGDYRIPFIAKHGQDHRFTKLKKEPMMDISGKWETTFEEGTEYEFTAVGEFDQNGNELSGTFMTETGDYRFLAGTIQDDKLYLSNFDGAHAFLFEAKIKADSTIIGSFTSGKHYKEIWSAFRNPAIKLADADTLTYLKPGFEAFNFSFPDTENKLVSLEDPAFEGKIKLVQLMGTWCPNCKDEVVFLREYFKENASEDVAWITIGFERYKEKEKSLEVLKTYKEKMQLDHPFLWGGYYTKDEASAALPMLNRVMAFPTMIILDQNNEIIWVHTGFSGPATSGYQAFTEKFNQVLQQLI